ncbi:MAG: hypothetical protein QXT77_07365 [Candidatus Methanomethylicaceae archaeon]
MAMTVAALERLVKEHGADPTCFTDGRHNWRRWRRSFAGNCASPVTLELNARPEWRNRKFLVVPKEGMSMTVEIEVPCRKCGPCLRRRAAHWRMRALAEYRAAEARGARSWFSTLTIRPEVRQHILDQVRSNIGYRRERKSGEPITLDFDALSPEEQFREKHRFISKEITRYVKRVRTNARAELRILCVAEVHEGGGALHGEPHYHMLWHETSPECPVRKQVLVSAWAWGFSQHKLVKDPKQATYLCKYLTKSNLARVRASVDYGNTS